MFLYGSHSFHCDFILIASVVFLFILNFSVGNKVKLVQTLTGLFRGTFKEEVPIHRSVLEEKGLTSLQRSVGVIRPVVARRRRVSVGGLMSSSTQTRKICLISFGHSKRTLLPLFPT